MTEEERYQKLANEKQAALDKSTQTYEDLINQNNVYSQGVDTYLNNYQTTQNDIYDKQLAYQTELQEQNKVKAEKEYQKEAQASKNAYYDFINPYGVQAEIQAKNGLTGSGYSETAKSQAWTTQQNRTAQARASMNEAKLQFDNAIKEAQLNNDTQKAQLALQILEQKQNEMLRSFNYVSEAKQNQLSNYQNLESDYNNRYNTLYSQIADEKAKAEAIRQYEKNFLEEQRQYNESLAQSKKQLEQAQKQWEAEQAEKQRQYNETLAFKKAQAAQDQANWEREYALSQQAANAKYSSGGSSGGSSSKSSGSSKKTSTSQNQVQLNNNTLSSNAQSIYNTIVNGIKTGKGLPFIGKSVGNNETTIKKAALNYFYQRGEISDNDLRILASRLGV